MPSGAISYNRSESVAASWSPKTIVPAASTPGPIRSPRVDDGAGEPAGAEVALGSGVEADEGDGPPMPGERPPSQSKPPSQEHDDDRRARQHGEP